MVSCVLVGVLVRMEACDPDSILCDRVWLPTLHLMALIYQILHMART